NILIVDDTPENLILIGSIINKLEVNIIKAQSGLEALAKIHDVELALAILDVWMPGMNGYELATQLNTDRAEDKVPIVFLTASNFNELEVYKGYGAGAVDYMFKPINNEILLSKINVFLEIFKHKKKIINDAAIIEKSADDLIGVIKALKKSEEKFRSVTHSASDAIITSNRKGIISGWNLGAEKIFGYKESEIMGKELTQIMPKQFAENHTKNIEQAVNSGSRHIVGKTIELVGLHKLGHEFPIELSLSEWESGSGLFFTGIIRDISSRRLAEKELQESKASLEEAQRIAHIGSWQWDMATNTVKWSEEMFRIFDITPESYDGTPKAILNILHPDDVDMFTNSMANNLQDGNQPVLEYRVIHKDGSIHYVIAEGRVSYDEAGKPSKSIGTVQDITNRKLAEKKLRESESHFTSLFENMIDGFAYCQILLKDNIPNDFIYLKVNKSFETLTGLKDVIGKKVSEIIPGIAATNPELIATYGRIASTGVPETFEAYIESLKMWLSIAAYSPEKGYFVSIFEVITDRKSAEDALLKSEELFKSVVNNSNDLTTLTDADGKITYISPQCENVTGYTPDKFFGMHIPDIIHTDDVARCNKAWEDVFSNQHDLYDFEYRIIDAQGEVRWFSHNAKMVFANNKIVGMQNTIRNTTRRKLVEQALKVNEEKYRTLLNSSPDGILLIDLKGNIVEVSEIGLELLGSATRDGLLGLDFLDLVPPDETPIAKEIIEKTLSEGLVQNTQLKIRRKNATLFFSEISSTLIQDHDGKPISFMMIIRDITQRMKLEAKQFHADRMANLGEMASGIAHEINQPLNIISLIMDNILFEASKDKMMEKDYLGRKIDKIFENITRIRNIIDHVRAFSRSNDDYILMDFVINSSIKNAVAMVSEQFNHVAIDLNLQLQENLPLILGNTIKFEQVIINLLSNAKDALLEKKEIEKAEFGMFILIKTYSEKQFVIIEVTDNGTGISKDDIDHIMLPFYTTKDSGKGTGLGLSISYQIIKDLGGTIEILDNEFLG
ncbi:MAG: PAS domain S-box protein, partial [Bacteroidales bacterium]